jgi:HSP20 family protein
MSKQKSRKSEQALQHPYTAAERHPWQEMERWFDEFSRRGAMSPFGFEWPHRFESAGIFGGRLPKVDMVDRENEIVVRAEMPGVQKDDLNVTITDNSVTIKATTKQEKKEAKDEYYRREMSRGEYLRTLELPHSVDEKKAKATFTDGVLELTLPKLEKTSRTKVSIE